jgi:hypothetical protein
VCSRSQSRSVLSALVRRVRPVRQGNANIRDVHSPRF